MRNKFYVLMISVIVFYHNTSYGTTSYIEFRDEQKHGRQIEWKP